MIFQQVESISTLNFASQPSMSDKLSPFELEVASKFDSMITTLRDLENQFSQARQELLRRSSSESKEGSKIFAVRGRVVVNKKRYYQNLEGDIQSLTKTFEDSCSKINAEFNSLRKITGSTERPEADEVSKNLAKHLPAISLSNSARKLESLSALGRSPRSPVDVDQIQCFQEVKSAKFVQISNMHVLDSFKKTLAAEEKTQSLPNLSGIQNSETESLKSESDLNDSNKIRKSNFHSPPEKIKSIKSYGFKLSPSEASVPKKRSFAPSFILNERLA